jgi:hypothetical protein
MVAGALLAGILGGFIIPDRPQPREITKVALTSSAEDTAARSKTAAQDKPQIDGQKIRAVPLESSAAAEKTESSVDAGRRTDQNSCAQETWPYRSPNCLDRTAPVEPAATIVSAKRVDPVVGVTAPSSPTGKDKSNPVASAEANTLTSNQKIVSAPKQQPSGEAVGNSEPEAAPTRPARERRKQAASGTEDDGQKGRRIRPSERTVARDRQIPDGVYFRGRDGRLYLAPEYRLDARPRYYAR